MVAGAALALRNATKTAVTNTSAMAHLLQFFTKWKMRRRQGLDDEAGHRATNSSIANFTIGTHLSRQTPAGTHT